MKVRVEYDTKFVILYQKGIFYLIIGVADRHWFQNISYGYDAGDGGGGGES